MFSRMFFVTTEVWISKPSRHFTICTYIFFVPTRFHDFFSDDLVGNGSVNIGSSSSIQNLYHLICWPKMFSRFFFSILWFIFKNLCRKRKCDYWTNQAFSRFSLIFFFSNNFAGNGSVNIGTSSAGQLGRDPSGSANYRSHIVRLNSIEPNTVMFSTKDYPILSDVSVPEIIDELEKQFDDKLCDLQGVRLVGANVYICLSRKDR